MARSQRSSAQDVEAYIKAHGTEYIIGVDEAGRGNLAGPIVAAAAVVSTDWTAPADIKDSKAFNNHDQLFEAIDPYVNDDRFILTTGMVFPSQIDEMGIDRAQAMAQGIAIREAMQHLEFKPLVVVDGLNLPAVSLADVEKVMTVPKADALISAVSLASIFAKVTQIGTMLALEKKYPGYGFERHCGYATKEHKAALMKLGPCAAHRRSYRPVREAAEAHEGGITIDDLHGLSEDELLEELANV